MAQGRGDGGRQVVGTEDRYPARLGDFAAPREYLPVLRFRSVGTSVAVQQKLMRHADVRTTMNTYGDVVTDEMAQAASKVAHLAIHRA